MVFPENRLFQLAYTFGVLTFKCNISFFLCHTCYVSVSENKTIKNKPSFPIFYNIVIVICISVVVFPLQMNICVFSVYCAFC